MLAECLASVAAIDEPAGDFEVVVVDDGSPVPLAGVVESYYGRLDIACVRQSGGGPAAARNAGAAVARGGVLAFLDCDCRPAADWLSIITATLRASPRCLVAGRTLNGAASNPYSATSLLVLDAVHAFYNRDPVCGEFVASSNMAAPADLFRELGGFDACRFRDAAEDRDLADRWRLAGQAIAYRADAIVRHVDELTLARFWRQNVGYGRGAWAYRRARSERASGSFGDSLSFHAALPELIGPLLAALPVPQRRIAVPLLGVWQVANTVGFALQAVESRLGARGPAVSPSSSRCVPNRPQTRRTRTTGPAAS